MLHDSEKLHDAVVRVVLAVLFFENDNKNWWLFYGERIKNSSFLWIGVASHFDLVDLTVSLNALTTGHLDAVFLCKILSDIAAIPHNIWLLLFLNFYCVRYFRPFY